MTDNYYSNPAISQSLLKHIGKSPEHLKYRIDNPQEPTKDMILGRAFHTLVLEPSKFDVSFAIAPECDRRTKAGKEIYAEFAESLSDDMEVITADDMEVITAMRESVMANDIASKLIIGDIEEPIFWIDEVTGIACKAKPDVFTSIGNRTIIVELKSCQSANADDFMRACFKYGYDLQAGMYLNGIETHYRPASKFIEFVFIAVEKTSPFAVNVLQADQYFIELGQKKYRDYMATYKDCLSTDNWYGYMGKEDNINFLTVPSWMIEKEI